MTNTDTIFLLHKHLMNKSFYTSTFKSILITSYDGADIFSNMNEKHLEKLKVSQTKNIARPDITIMLEFEHIYNNDQQNRNKHKYKT